MKEKKNNIYPKYLQLVLIHNEEFLGRFIYLPLAIPFSPCIQLLP